ATLIFHANLADQNQIVHVLTNLAVAGGLLYRLAYGPERISADGQQGFSMEA
ncbi:MAG: LysR family transcriptional regulator, partial [Nitrospiraceae bacterium]